MQDKKMKGSSIMMVRPKNFGFNQETASSNAFQKSNKDESMETIKNKAIEEFDKLVQILKKNKINVEVFDDMPDLITPDSVFPNNWISFHESGKMVLYPMMATNRRLERREDIIAHFSEIFTETIDLTYYESENKFLEGTGSIVFDYANKIAYAIYSPRTDKEVLETLCKKIGFSAIVFSAVDNNGKDIYHTNVMMCITPEMAIICLECIPNEKEKENVINSLSKTGHNIISISYKQVEAFAGNMYGLENTEGKKFLIMSQQAFENLEEKQIQQIKEHREIIYSPIDTIEKYGGGSVRCMVADIRI